MSEISDSTEPCRVQLSRRKGWRMPPNTVKVDRSTPYGNPWKRRQHQDAVKLSTGEWMLLPVRMSFAGAVDRFRRWMKGEFGRTIGPIDHPLYGLVMCPGEPFKASDLRGKNLACWCPLDQPCHADALLELANADPPNDP